MLNSAKTFSVFRASFQVRDQLAGYRARSDPDRVDAVVIERFAAVEDLLRDSAVDAPDRDLRSLWHGFCGSSAAANVAMPAQSRPRLTSVRFKRA